MSVHVQSANAINPCCDNWSKKVLSSSYLGVTAHFSLRSDRHRHIVTLAVQRLTSSHTASTIWLTVEEILAEWGIDPNILSAVLTDNGSNMVPAFKAKFDEDDDDVEELAESSMPDDEQEFPDCEMEHDIEFSSFNRISCFSRTLQLVVSKFDELDKLLKELMKHAHAVVRKFNTSTKATERLIATYVEEACQGLPYQMELKIPNIRASY